MGIVHLFGERKVDPSKQAAGAANQNNQTAEVVEVVFNTNKPIKTVPSSPIFGQMRAMLINHGADFSCKHTQEDFKLMTHLVTGIFDRLDGNVTKQSCLGAALLYALEEAPVPDDTEELFGDLLGQLD